MASTPSALLQSTAPPAPLASKPALGPIARLPLEVLTHILNQVMDLCDHPWGRQCESQNFVRVCRAFHSAYLLSEAMHECAVDSLSATRLLISALGPGQVQSGKMERLWVGLALTSNDLLMAELVGSCQDSLRSFVWTPKYATARVDHEVQAELAQAWAGCDRMEVFSLGEDARNLTGGEVERLLASWPNLRELDLGPCFIDHGRSPLPTKIPEGWKVPTRLRSFKTDTYSHNLTLLVATARASAATLKHLTIDLSFGPYDDENDSSDGSGVEWHALGQVLRQIPNARSLTFSIDFIVDELEDDPAERCASLAQRKGFEELIFSRGSLTHYRADLLGVVEPLARNGLKKLQILEEDWNAWEGSQSEDEAGWEYVTLGEVCQAVLWAEGVAFELVD